jgi:hypothetical protein
LSHVNERADSDVGGGVVLTHDGLEVPHCEEKFFNGATPLESVTVLRQRRKLSWKCRRFRCCPQLVLTTWCRVFPTRRPDTADVSATSCDVGFFFLCRMSCRYLTADMSWYGSM